MDANPEVPKVHLFGLPVELRREAQHLLELVYEGTDKWLRPQAGGFDRVRTDHAFLADYRAAVHRGFRHCQERIVQRVLAGDRSAAESGLHQQIMDCIAWQLLGEDLYHARRFYRGEKKQPSLQHSNFSSVVAAAEEIMSADPRAFALVSDLTSFIQIGDLLIKEAETPRFTISEVKEGAVNERVVKFAKFMRETPCDRAAEYFRAQEGEMTFRQLERVMRQASRMDHVVEFVNTGSSFDPDESALRNTVESDVPLTSYDPVISDLVTRSSDRGWAIEVLSDCLYLGAYRSEFRVLGRPTFEAWFYECGGKEGFPVVNFSETSCATPLGLPVFSRGLTRAQKYELMFADVVVYVAIDMDGFISLCNERGLPARWATKRETARAARGKHRPWKHRGQAIRIDNVGELHDGIISRMLHHGVAPESAIQILKDYARAAPRS